MAVNEAKQSRDVVKDSRWLLFLTCLDKAEGRYRLGVACCRFPISTSQRRYYIPDDTYADICEDRGEGRKR